MYKATEKSRSFEGRFQTIEQYMLHVNMSRTSVMRLCSESDALIRFGRCLRVDVEKADAFLVRNYTVR